MKQDLAEKIFEKFYSEEGQKIGFDMPTLSYINGIKKGISYAVAYLIKDEKIKD